MLGQWLPRRQDPPSGPEIVPLSATDVGRLDLGWRSMFSADDLRRHVNQHRGRAFWMPATREYVIGGNWRHRREIGSLVEIGARGDHRFALIDALMSACAQDRCALVIYSDTTEVRSQRWHEELGFELVQEIIIYELHGPPTASLDGPRRLRFEPITPMTMADLYTVDQAAFPYMWWNSPAEFENYLDQPGVAIEIGRDQHGEPLAYIGITLYQGWGHLDRLAVVPGRQGQGYGLEALKHAVTRIYQHGSRRIGLSTQADNERSQRLYERFGFRRTYRTDYKLYGYWLVGEPELRRAILSGRPPWA